MKVQNIELKAIEISTILPSLFFSPTGNLIQLKYGTFSVVTPNSHAVFIIKGSNEAFY
jgi:hypothetical protein